MAYGSGGQGYTDTQTKKRPGRKQDVTDGMDPVAAGYARSRYNQGIFDHTPAAAAHVGANRKAIPGGLKSPSKFQRRKRS